MKDGQDKKIQVLLLSESTFMDQGAKHFIEDALKPVKIYSLGSVQDAEQALSGILLDMVVFCRLTFHSVGAQEVKRLHALAPGTPFLGVGFTGIGPRDIDALKRAGLDAVILEEDSYETAVCVLHGLLDGNPPEERSAPDDTTQGRILTPRQQEVRDLLVAGYGNKEIAKRLTISVGTAKAHVAAVLKQYGVCRRTQFLALDHTDPHR